MQDRQVVQYRRGRSRILFAGSFCLAAALIAAVGFAKTPDRNRFVPSDSSAVRPSVAAPSIVTAPSPWRALTTVDQLPCTVVQAFAGGMETSLCSQGDSSSEAAAAAATPPPAIIQDKALFETPHGFIATASLPDLGEGSFLAVHGGGVVTALSANGDVLWNQPSLNFTKRTGRYPLLNLPFSPNIPFGFDPANPYTEVGAHPFAVGDLNGDGIADVAVAHFFRATGAIRTQSGTLVSVLDGRNGNFIWSHLYNGYVPELLIKNGTLVVALEIGDYNSSLLIGENGARSSIEAWSFAASDVPRIWTVSTGIAWSRWLALESIDENTLVAGWTNTTLGAGGSTYGHVLSLSLANGAVAWDAIAAGYPRFLRFDASRSRVVAVEQTDPADVTAAAHYSIVARGLTNGAVVATSPQADAFPLSFVVGDVNGDGNSDWVVGDLFLSAGLVPCPDTQTCLANSWTFRAGRIRALSGSDGTQIWSQQRGVEGSPDAFGAGGVDTARPYGLVLSGNSVIAASFMPGKQDREIEALNGVTGAQVWARRETNLFFPMFLSSDVSAGRPVVRVASSRTALYGGHPIGVAVTLDATGTNFLLRPDTRYQVVRSVAVDTGADLSIVSLLGRINAVASTNVDGDNMKDLLVGGESGAVFALDGNNLTDSPRVLWRRQLSSPVREIYVVDFDGDGPNELVVSASHEVVVLDPQTGAIRYSIPYATEIVQSIVTSDVNGDGKIDIVVPTSSIKAYTGATGAQLWNYAPVADGTPYFSNAIVTQDRHVIAQYLVSAPTNGNGVEVAPENRGYVALNGADGTVAWSDFQQTPSSHPFLWKSTTAGSGVNASTVAFTWVNGAAATPGIQIDRLDIATGQMLASGILTADTSNLGTFDAGDHGAMAYGWVNSGLLGTSALTTVLSGYFPHELAWGTFAGLGQQLVMAQFSDTISVLGANAFDAPTVSPVGTRTATIQASDLIVVDLDSDGSDEVVAWPFDYDGWGSSLSREGGYVTAPSSQAHGLKVLRVAPVFPLTPTAVSRKVHGAAGPFDINLPLTGTGGVECRSGGANSDYQIVLTFPNPVTVGSVVVTTGFGRISKVTVDQDESQGRVAVDLTGVTNFQTIKITLSNIADGTNSGDLIVPMVVNIGDVNASGSVTTGDTNLCKAQALQPVTNDNFRTDINASGSITTGDVNLIKQRALSQF